MAAILASGVSYTVLGKGPGSRDENCVTENDVKIVFGDGASTYPSGGIPLSGLSKYGFPNSVGTLVMVDMSNADGYLYKWDKVNNKIRIYQSPAVAAAPSVAAAFSEVTTAFVPASGVTIYALIRGH